MQGHVMKCSLVCARVFCSPFLLICPNVEFVVVSNERTTSRFSQKNEWHVRIPGIHEADAQLC